MERIAHVPIEKLPEGRYLATSDAAQGLVTHSRTISGTLAITRPLLAAQAEREAATPPPLAADAFDDSLVIRTDEGARRISMSRCD